MKRAAVLLVFAGCVLSPSVPERPVELTAEQRADYWAQFERRFTFWFHGNPPEYPSADEVYERLDFVEVPHEFLPTCDFIPSRFVARIGDDKWGSGCVPHEIGHAVMRMIDHRCASDYEHQGNGVPAPESCL